MAINRRTADEAVHVDANGNQVEATNPNVAFQVVAKGGHITPAMEEKFPKIFGVDFSEADKKGKSKSEESVVKSDGAARESKKSAK